MLNLNADDFNKNYYNLSIYKDFFNTDFYIEPQFFLIHPDYIKYFYQNKKNIYDESYSNIIKNEDYYKFINVEFKLKDKNLNRKSFYVPFIFKGVFIKIWKF